ncbi:MAG TPA: hypothetical protein VKS79_23050 [Gemmataceae bacterium]|nr:hypothetical protein [Gemmataceae bacterium]
MTLRSSLLAAILVTSVPASTTFADEKEDLAAKQKAAADAVWKKLELEKTPPPVVTANFMVFAPQSEAKTKALADMLERYYKVATRALKFDDKERPWNGQMAVFLLEWQEYKNLMRKVEKKTPAADETSFSSFTGDEPTLGVGSPAGTKGLPDPQEAVNEMLTCLLRKKMGAGDPPTWIAIGFARATAYRVSNPGSRGKPSGYGPANAELKEIWGETLPPKARYSYGAYIVDYLAYGPLSEQFPQFVLGLRPDESTNGVSVETALKGINLEPDALVYWAAKWQKPKEEPKPKEKPKKP